MKTISSPRLSYRELKIDDTDLIVEWRNSKRLRKVSLTKDKFTAEGHKNWFINSRDSRSDFIFSEKLSKLPIGMISLEHKTFQSMSDNCFELSKFIGNDSFGGKGYAFEATEAVLNYFKKYNDVNFFFAVTRADNIPNIKLNQKVGFVIESFPSYIEHDPRKWIFMKMDIK